MVRLYAGDTSKKLAALYEKCLAKMDASRSVNLGEGYGDCANLTLESLFD
jgi:hypothetical protein